jgi:hypothetical protein
MISHQRTPRHFVSWLTSPMLAPVVLVVVAALQFGFAYSGAMLHWKGGGFGMFATTDRPNNRVLVLIAIDSTGQEFVVRVPATGFASAVTVDDRLLARVIALPTHDRLTRVATAALYASVAPSNSSTGRPPPRFVQSAYETPLTRAFSTRPVLEIVARQPMRGTLIRLREVRASVMRVQVDWGGHRLWLQQVGPSVSVVNHHGSARGSHFPESECGVHVTLRSDAR